MRPDAVNVRSGHVVNLTWNVAKSYPAVRRERPRLRTCINGRFYRGVGSNLSTARLMQLVCNVTGTKQGNRNDARKETHCPFLLEAIHMMHKQLNLT